MKQVLCKELYSRFILAGWQVPTKLLYHCLSSAGQGARYTGNLVGQDKDGKSLSNTITGTSGSTSEN